MPLSETKHVARNKISDEKGSRIWGEIGFCLTPLGGFYVTGWVPKSRK